MLEFNNTMSVIPGLTELLKKEGSTLEVSAGNSTGRRTKCLELLGQSFRIYDWSDRSDTMNAFGLSVVFAETDLQDRLSPTPVNPGKAISFDRQGVLRNYLQEDGKLKYTYSERLFYQYDAIIEVLLNNRDTRQAFMSVWDPQLDIDSLERDRVPCSIGYHFILREGKLNLLYYMRSLNVQDCVGNDIYTSSRLLEEIAQRVGAEPGFLQFIVGSMHLFIKEGAN